MYGIGSTPHFPGGICTPSNAVIPVAMTDADGRFEIHGLGRDRLIFFRLAGPSLATSEVRVLTRPGTDLRFEHVVGPGQEFIYGPTFDFAAGPGITLEGAVTDEDSSATLGGVAIECQAAEGLWGGNQEFLSTTTDERGHYRIEGVNPIAKSTLKVVPEGPYLEMDYISLPKPHGLDPIHRDLKLRARSLGRRAGVQPQDRPAGAGDAVIHAVPVERSRRNATRGTQRSRWVR